jgi:hypothetical protein
VQFVLCFLLPRWNKNINEGDESVRAKGLLFDLNLDKNSELEEFSEFLLDFVE